jgi:molybdopterin-synthase adenylyltransferase
MGTEISLERYVRQMTFAPLGQQGQLALLDSHVVIVGLGATGSVLANLLARAGVGHLLLLDRDFVELNNLQRQFLYDEADAAAVLPKAIAAADKLRAINGSIEIRGEVVDVSAANILELVAGADLVLDGCDNFATRYLINDACVKLGISWIYCGVLASYGMTMNIIPGQGPCLRCVMGELPAPGTMPTCDTAGILGPTVSVMGSLVAAEAIKLLSRRGAPSVGMRYVDVWDGSFEKFELADRRPDCPACGTQHYEFLNAESGTRTTTLCGRDAVQVSLAGASPTTFSLADLGARWRGAGITVSKENAFLLRAALGQYDLTVFSDGRAIIKGTQDEAVASTLYARYVGM